LDYLGARKLPGYKQKEVQLRGKESANRLCTPFGTKE
jgi:hypothetical protein